ncbi:MAG: hypothetical protein ACLP8S_30490 [Solirubrobacteraceae bacterium]
MLSRSGTLLHLVILRGPVDEYLLLIFRLVVGSGRLLFPEGVFARWGSWTASAPQPVSCVWAPAGALTAGG